MVTLCQSSNRSCPCFVLWNSGGPKHNSQTTTLAWVNTEKIAADSLTKSMKPKTLTHVMAGEWMDLTPTKNNECEKNDHMAH